MKMAGMMARSLSFSALSCEASLVKTGGRGEVRCGMLHVRAGLRGTLEHTQTWCEERDVEIGEKLLLVGVELTESCNDVARQADADDFEDGLKDEEAEVGERGRGLPTALSKDLEGQLVGVGGQLSEPVRRWRGDRVHVEARVMTCSNRRRGRLEASEENGWLFGNIFGEENKKKCWNKKVKLLKGM